MVRISDFIETHFLKKRCVFGIHRSNYAPIQISNSTYKVLIIQEALYKTHNAFLLKYISKEKLERRMSNPNCTGFIAINRKTNAPVGFYWSLEAKDKAAWHDKFKIEPGTALVFNAFVVKEVRRQGIYYLLQSAIHNYLFFTKKCNTVYTIVEESNKPSMNANIKFGLNKYATNYLVKLFKRNICSIYKDHRNKWSLYYVFQNAKSHSI